MDTSDSVIKFDENGICDHCNNYFKNILPNWQPNINKQKQLELLSSKIRKEGEGKNMIALLG